MEYVATKYDIKIATREQKWLAEYPNLAKRIQELEAAVSSKQSSKK
jgi:hypothetical protein